MKPNSEPRPPLETAFERIEERTGESLSPSALARVYERVAAQTDKPSHAAPPRILRWSLAGAVACSVAALAVWRTAVSPNTVDAPVSVALVRQSGEVSWSRGVAPWQHDRAAMPLADPQVTLAPNAQLAFEGDRARWLALGPARLTVEKSGRPTLTDGVMALSVAKGGARAPWRMIVGGSRVTVHGTRFTVEARAGTLVAVQVAEGSVTLAAPNEPIGRQLQAGDSWDNGVRSPLHGQALQRVGEVTRASDTVAGALHVTSVPSGATVTVAGRDVGLTPLWMRLRPGGTRIRIEHAGFEAWEQEADVTPNARRDLDVTLHSLPAAFEPTTPESPPAAAPTQAVSPAHFAAAERLLDKRDCEGLKKALRAELAERAPPAQRTRAWLLLGECYVRTARRQEALAAYDRVAALRGGDEGQATAEFEGAKLSAELGRTGEGLRRFDRFIETHPKSRFREAAAFRRCELLVKLKRHDDARECLLAHRQSYPTSARARDVALMLASLACLKGDAESLRRGLRSYVSLAAATTTDEETFYQLARCLSRAPHPENRDVIDRYLKDHPNSRFARELGELKNRPQ